MIRILYISICMCLWICTDAQKELCQYVDGTFNQVNIDACGPTYYQNGKVDSHQAVLETVNMVNAAQASFTFEDNFANAHFSIRIEHDVHTFSFEINNGSITDISGGGSQVIYSGGFEASKTLALGIDEGILAVFYNDVPLVDYTASIRESRIKATIEILNNVDLTGRFELTEKYFNPSVKVNFVEQAYFVTEGDSVAVELELSLVSPTGQDVNVDINFTSNVSPHFDDFTVRTVTNPSGSTGPVSVYVPTDVANGLKDENLEYTLEIVSVDGVFVDAGEQYYTTINVVDDYIPYVNNLNPGDLMFVGFDNDIGGGQDRVMITNLVEIEPNTSFQLCRALYDHSNDWWLSPIDNSSGAIPSIRFTYTGSDTLEVNTVFCIDVDAASDTLFIPTLELDGLDQLSDFKIEVAGNGALDKIDISTSTFSAMFLVQGEWLFGESNSKLFGNVLSGISIGNAWYNNSYTPTPSLGNNGGSNTPDDIECFEISTIDNNFEWWAYYECSDPYETTIYELRESIANFDNWENNLNSNESAAFSPHSLPTGICESNCIILIDPCELLSFEFSSDGPASLSFGDLKYEGVIVTNYLISWVDENGNEVFQSGAGTFYDEDNMYSHPRTDIPAGGNLVPVVLDSDYGMDLDCFDPIDVLPITCSSNYERIYLGPGGVTTEMEIEVDPSNPVIKFEWFDYSVPDILKVIYDGVVLLEINGSYSNLAVEVPVTGTNYEVTVEITNTTPTNQTQWSFGFAGCCDALECLPTISVDKVTQITQLDCAVRFDIESGFNCDGLSFENTCTGYYYPPGYGTYIDLGTICDVNYDYINHGCNDLVGTVESSLSNLEYSFDFTDQSDYSYYKSFFQDSFWSNNQDAWITFSLKDLGCQDDAGFMQITFFPGRATLSYDDVNFVISLEHDAINPFVDECANCSYEYYDVYEDILAATAFTGQISESIQIFAARTLDEEVVLSSTYARSYNTHCGLTVDSFLLMSTDVNDIENTWSFYKQDSIGAYTLLVQQAGDTLGCSSSIIEPSVAENRANEVKSSSLNNLKVYPNPASSLFYVSFDSVSDEPIRLEAIDITGKSYLNQTLENQKGRITHEVSTTGLLSGIYTISVKQGSTLYFEKLIIIND